TLWITGVSSSGVSTRPRFVAAGLQTAGLSRQGKKPPPPGRAGFAPTPAKGAGAILRPPPARPRRIPPCGRAPPRGRARWRGGAGALCGGAVDSAGAARADERDKPADMGKAGQPAKAPPKADMKKIKFNARGEPWPKVFDWLAKETGKPVITNYKVTGSFTVHVPEGAAYSLPDTVDLINEALIDQKYILIQRDRSFTLVPADEKVPP